VIPFLLHIAQKEPHWDILRGGSQVAGTQGLSAIDSLISLLPTPGLSFARLPSKSWGGSRATQAVTGILKAVSDKQPLVRSASLQALAQIGLEETVDRAQIIRTMLQRLADREGEEAVVRESALEGLATLEGKVGPQRAEVVRALVAVLGDRNPRLAGKSQKILSEPYKVSPSC